MESIGIWKEMQNQEGMNPFLRKYSGVATLTMLILSVAITCLGAMGVCGTGIVILSFLLMVISSIWFIGWYKAYKQRNEKKI